MTDGMHDDDMRTLQLLGKKKVIRVLATGRNLYSVESVLDAGFPIDYLIFSTGAGIMTWPEKKLLYSQYLHRKDVARITQVLMRLQVSFMIHLSVPQNHRFFVYKGKNLTSDFYKRLQIYPNYYMTLKDSDLGNFDASQFLCILPNDHALFDSIQQELSGVKVIKTSSPIGKDSLWLEIFPENVSKGHAALWLCNHLGINAEQSMGIGNDYNDIDLLDIVGFPYVVSNAPEEMKFRYPVVDFQLNGGFTQAVNHLLEL